MSYQVYFSNLDEENRALLLTLLRLKEEAGQLEPGEANLLIAMRGYSAPPHGLNSEPSTNGKVPEAFED